MKQMAKQQSGFTLVEIAIVLVIIGLLLGGVLKGQELIHSAKVKNMVNDLRTVSSLAYGYQDRFRSLPGDQNQTQLTAAFGVDGATSRATACSTGTGCAPNNGRIDGNWNDTAGSETFVFWQHVRLANLATGATNTTLAEYLPRNADGGVIGVESMGAGGSGVSPTYIASMRGSFFVCSSGILGRYAKQIDMSMDDGNTASGTVQTVLSGATRGSNPVTTAEIVDGDQYTVCAAY